MEATDRSDVEQRAAESRQPDPLLLLRPEIAPCIACGQDRGGLAIGTPCPECGERSPPMQSLVLPAKRAQGGSRAFAAGIGLYAIGTMISVAVGTPLMRWLNLTPLAALIAMRVWNHRLTPRLGYGFSVGGVTFGGVNGLVRLPWRDYQAIEGHRGEVRLIASTFGATVLRVDVDQASARQIAAEIDRYRLRSREVPGSSIGSGTLAATQLCSTCGACRHVAIGGACQSCGEPMPAGTHLLSGRSSPGSALRIALQDMSSAVGIALIVTLGLAFALIAGGLSGEWFVTTLMAGPVVAISLAIALFRRWTSTEPRPRLRDARDRHWLLAPSELRVITPLGDDRLPWDKIAQIERLDRRGRWIAVRATPNDPRLRAETIWLASERDVDAAMTAFSR